MLKSVPAIVNGERKPPAVTGFASRIRALHAATSERGPVAGTKAAVRQAVQKDDALSVAAGNSATFKLFDQAPVDAFIDIHGDSRAAEDRIRAAVSALPEASSARPQAAQLDSRGAAFLSPSSTSYKPKDSEKEGIEKQHLLATTKGRHDLRHAIASMLRPDDGSRGPSVCGCGLSGHKVDAVNIHLSERGKASASGVFRCDSAVLCSVCSVRRGMEIQERLTRAVSACTAEGGTVWFLTPTVRRKADQALGALRAGFQAAWREARQGAGWARPSDDAGVLGATTVLEAPWSPHTGWGLHGHALMFFAHPQARPGESQAQRVERIHAKLALAAEAFVADAKARAEAEGLFEPRPVSTGRLPLHLVPHPLYDEETFESVYGDLIDSQPDYDHWLSMKKQRPVCDVLMRRFLGRLPSHGLSGTIDAQDIELARDGTAAAKYLGKIAAEVAHGWVKEGRKEGSTAVHPFALAARGGMRESDGTPMEIPGLEKVSRERARELWQEYAGAMKGIRLGVISPKLAERLGIEACDDEEKAEEQKYLEDGELGTVPAKMWNHLVRRCLAGTFLHRIEKEIDPSESDDFAKAIFADIRFDFLETWLETGDEEARLWAGIWNCDGEDDEVDDEDSDASFLRNDYIRSDERKAPAAPRIDRKAVERSVELYRKSGQEMPRKLLAQMARLAKQDAADAKVADALAVEAAGRLRGVSFRTAAMVKRVVDDIAAANPALPRLDEARVLAALNASV